MADVRPFRAFRPRPEIAARVSCPPYDVISSSEARKLAEGNPMSFLHVTRPEIDLPPEVDEHAEDVYQTGKKNLISMIAEGLLVQDAEPRLYVYEQTMGSHTQTGIVGCASVDDYDRDIIKKHEKTRADKEDDRTHHIDVLGAHDEPVFLTYRADGGLRGAVSAVKGGSPLIEFESEDGVFHRLWAAPREESLLMCERFGAVSTLYVADGHHRSAAASRVARLRRGSGGEEDVFMAVLFPHDEMNIMPYNRVVRDPKRRSAEELRALIGGVFDLQETEAPAPEGPKSFGLFLAGVWYRATVRPGTFDAEDPVGSLDCSICQDQLLGPIFGVTDPRRDKHVDFVGGIRGAAELERRVRSGEMDLGVHLYPTQMRELMAVSDAGLLMPPKSTWFEPKLKSGLFVHVF